MWARSEAGLRGSDAMVLGFSTIMEFFGLGGITGIDVFFRRHGSDRNHPLHDLLRTWCLIGGVADGIADAIPFLDINLEMDAEGVFHMLTIQGLLSFMMMFGIFGLAVSQGGLRRPSQPSSAGTTTGHGNRIDVDGRQGLPS